MQEGDRPFTDIGRLGCSTSSTCHVVWIKILNGLAAQIAHLQAFPRDLVALALACDLGCCRICPGGFLDTTLLWRPPMISARLNHFEALAELTCWTG